MKQYIIIKQLGGMVEIASKVAGQIYTGDEALKRARIHVEIMQIGEPHVKYRICEVLE